MDGTYKMCPRRKNDRKNLGILRVLEWGVAHPRGGFSYVFAYNSGDSESCEPVLQHEMYYRLYHRSWFAGRKTYARHVPRRGAPAGLRDRDRRSITEGCFPAI